jgi:type III secretion protein T
MDLPPDLRDSAYTLLTATVRLLALLSMLPMFGKQSGSKLLRTAICLAFVLPVLPILTAQQAGLGEPLPLLPMILKEACVGFCLGWALAIPFWMAEAVGLVISNQYGASVGGDVSPLTGNETSPLGTLILYCYTVAMLMHGGLNAVLDTYYGSYQVWPLASAWPRLDSAFFVYWLGLLDSLVRGAVLLASPAMVSMLLAEIGLAIVNLFAPQMPVFFLAMPVKACISLLILVLYLTTLIMYLGDRSLAYTVLPELAKLAK